MGIEIPRDAGGWASGMAAARKGRATKTKECEKYMTERSGSVWQAEREAKEDRCRTWGPHGIASRGLIYAQKRVISQIERRV
jgi:hypothetical protein